MAYNGSLQNSDTEVFLARTEIEDESNDNKNLDYVDDWRNVEVNIQNAIWRGKNLREKKAKPDRTKNECIVPNINIFESFVKQPRVRKGYLETLKNNASQITPRPRCPCIRTNSAASSYFEIDRISRTNTKQTKAQKGKRCPMRIAELAVPSKRQCIETWRNKSDILPEFMVERLKQHVMDQTPIVKIPEAIYCFQNGRRVSPKNCSFRWLSSKHQLNEPRSSRHQMDARMLCILFAQKVAERLARPINITLNSDLERLSTIVSSDIAKIMSKCQCTTRTGRQYNAIQTDVSNKITVWITGILDDLSCKLLEEDLRAKMEVEAQIKRILKFSERVVTIIKTILEQQNYMKSEDLEDEEGPVLDFIDEVVDNVMNICKPPQLDIGSDSDRSGSTKDVLSGEESEKLVKPTQETSDNKMSELEEILKSETSTQVLTEKTDDGVILVDSNENLTDSEYFRNEISNIIDYVNIKESGDDNMSNGSGDDIENGSRDDIENEGISPEAGIENATNEDILPEVEKKQNTKGEDSTAISPESGIEHDTNDEKFDEIVGNTPIVDQNNEATDNAAETHSNVSERFEIFTDDSDDDKNSKKVMFHKKDLVKPEISDEQIITSTEEGPTPEPVKHKQAQWNPQNNKSNIMFAEPNQNLLSDADESWPADLGDKPMLKVSESASKSVSSLGRITENDEKQMSSPEVEDSMADKGMGDTILQVNGIMEILNHILPIENHGTTSQPKGPLIKVYIETIITEPGETQVDSKILNDISETKSVPNTSKEKSFDESSKQDSGESELVRTGSTTSRTEDDTISTSHKTLSQVDYGWKVQPKTAPSWVISWGQGRGEPSEDSIPIEIRPAKVSEIELRKWCKELEKAFINLEMWSDWISATCKETLFVLQQKELNCPALAQKGAINWIRLKKNVHKDALLWTKLYQRTDKNFKSLKKKYNNIEFSSIKMPSVLNRTILSKMREFEELSAKLHKMGCGLFERDTAAHGTEATEGKQIVAAEYFAMCACTKTKSRYHSNKEYLGYRTK